MFLGNINTIPTTVNLNSGGGGGLVSTNKFFFNGNTGSLSTTSQFLWRYPDAISISCWVTFGDEIFTGTTVENYVIVDQAGNSQTSISTGYSLYVTRTATGAKLLRFQIGTGTAPSNPSQQRAQINLNALRTSATQVFYILATYNASGPGTIALYLRGEGIQPQENTQQPQLPGNISYNNQTNRFCVGNTSPTANVGFEGHVDELGIFSEVLNSSNADDIYNWDVNGNLLNYSNDNNLNIGAWYRMGEDTTFAGTSFTMPNSANGNTSERLESTDLGLSDNQQPGLPPPQ